MEDASDKEEDERLLRPEALREKDMDVSSMTALRQRIAVSRRVFALGPSRRSMGTF